MQLNKHRIKEYIIKYNKKCAQKLIKASHMNTCKYNKLFYSDKK